MLFIIFLVLRGVATTHSPNNCVSNVCFQERAVESTQEAQAAAAQEGAPAGHAPSPTLQEAQGQHAGALQV